MSKGWNKRFRNIVFKLVLLFLLMHKHIYNTVELTILNRHRYNFITCLEKYKKLAIVPTIGSSKYDLARSLRKLDRIAETSDNSRIKIKYKLLQYSNLKY